MVHKDITPDMFKDIDFPHRDIPDINVSKYRIYSDHKHFILVEADNAQSAIELSGIRKPVRVLRDSIYLQNVLVLAGITTRANVEPELKPKPEPLMLPESEMNSQAAVPETTEILKTESIEPSETPPTETEAALSSEEVDKLLTPDS
jgi:hypothetical protein